ncbi:MULTISPECIES: hypothetical protein [Haloferax]|nr:MULTISPECIES: hypothetical protein [Haloferax]
MAEKSTVELVGSQTGGTMGLLAFFVGSVLAFLAFSYLFYGE